MPRQEAKRARFDLEPKADTRKGVYAPFCEVRRGRPSAEVQQGFHQRIDLPWSPGWQCWALAGGHQSGTARRDPTVSAAAKQHIVSMDLSNEHVLLISRLHQSFFCLAEFGLISCHPVERSLRPETGLPRSGPLQSLVFQPPLSSTALPDGLDTLSGANKALTTPRRISTVVAMAWSATGGGGCDGSHPLKFRMTIAHTNVCLWVQHAKPLALLSLRLRITVVAKQPVLRAMLAKHPTVGLTFLEQCPRALPLYAGMF